MALLGWGQLVRHMDSTSSKFIHVSWYKIVSCWPASTLLICNELVYEQDNPENLW